jgi:hypothetical protein
MVSVHGLLILFLCTIQDMIMGRKWRKKTEAEKNGKLDRGKGLR